MELKESLSEQAQDCRGSETAMPWNPFLPAIVNGEVK